jgi:hypothetical protein
MPGEAFNARTVSLRLLPIGLGAAGLVGLSAFAGALVQRPESIAEVGLDPGQIHAALSVAKLAVEDASYPTQAIAFDDVFLSSDNRDPVVCGRYTISDYEDPYRAARRFVYRRGDLSIDDIASPEALTALWRDHCQSEHRLSVRNRHQAGT